MFAAQQFLCIPAAWGGINLKSAQYTSVRMSKIYWITFSSSFCLPLTFLVLNFSCAFCCSVLAFSSILSQGALPGCPEKAQSNLSPPVKVLCCCICGRIVWTWRLSIWELQWVTTDWLGDIYEACYLPLDKKEGGLKDAGGWVETNAPSFLTFLLLADWFLGVMGLPWWWQIEAAIGGLTAKFAGVAAVC